MFLTYEDLMLEFLKPEDIPIPLVHMIAAYVLYGLKKRVKINTAGIHAW